MDNKQLTDKEEKFCLVYACGPSPYNGNAKKTFDLVFNGMSGVLVDADEDSQAKHDVEVALTARRLIMRDDIKERIDQLQSESMVTAATLRPRLTETLLKTADECSTLIVEDRFGKKVSPAPLRSVAVGAISKLTDMYGIKEDIAHKVMLEGADGDGITFNLIVPQKQNENEISELEV